VDDINNDGIADILVVTRKGVELLENGQTTLIVSTRHIRDIDTGDVDGDSKKEIVVGLKRGKVKIFTIDGEYVNGFKAFGPVSSDVRVSVGDLGY